MNQEHIGSDFDDLLREEGILESARAVAAKRIIAFQIAQEMERRQLAKLEMARRIRTSRLIVPHILRSIRFKTF